MSYKIIIKREVFDDIQDGIDYYNSKQDGLGVRFFNAVEQHYDVLSKNPLFQVR